MIKTKHDITIGIDDKDYEVTVKEITSDIKAKLNESLSVRGAKFEAVDDKRFELAELENSYEINKTILADGSIVDKAKVWFEQKELNQKIFALKKELNKLNTSVADIDSELEQYHKEVFDMCVSGKHALSLKQKIDELGLSYTLVYQNIKQAVQKAYEKK